MASRPYIQKTVIELSVLFDRSSSDADELHKLLGELKYRSTPTAKRLRAKVEVALKELESKGNDVVHEERAETSKKGEDPNPRWLKCKACATTLRIPVRAGRNSYACSKCGQAFETRLEDDLLEVVFTIENR